jgi:hypothetical protein
MAEMKEVFHMSDPKAEEAVAAIGRFLLTMLKVAAVVFIVLLLVASHTWIPFGIMYVISRRN